MKEPVSIEEKRNSKAEQVKWQPVMMIVNRPIVCECGEPAVFISGKMTGEYNELDEVDCWCQTCLAKSQQPELEP